MSNASLRERYGVEGIIYLVVLALGMSLTIGFSIISFMSARDARNQSDSTAHLANHLCSVASAAFSDSNLHVRHPLRSLLLDAAYARRVASLTETGQRARVDAATSEKYTLLASQVTDLPPLNC